jgi:hypothetical protein
VAQITNQEIGSFKERCLDIFGENGKYPFDCDMFEIRMVLDDYIDQIRKTEEFEFGESAILNWKDVGRQLKAEGHNIIKNN